MNKKTLFPIIAAIIVAAIAIAAIKGSSKKVADGGVYCQQDGTLSASEPIQSHRSYCIKSDSSGKAYAVNAPSEYSFTIVDDLGNTVKDFVITHTQLIHVIVARKDLAYFQHLHPDFDQGTGVFTLSNLTFPADGTYRIFADFAVQGSQMDSMGMPLTATPSEDIAVGTGATYAPVALGSEMNVKTFDGMQVSLSTGAATPVSGAETMLTYSLSQNGKPVTDLQSYLGALGHAVVLREGNLDFIHAHPSEDVNAPQTGKVDFMVYFPEAGKYKVFTQFQRGGKVITTDFVLDVAIGQSSGSSNDVMTGGASMSH